MIQITAYANCNHAYIVWKTSDVIPNCLGFALFRRLKGGVKQTVETHVGPADGTKTSIGMYKPSTQWPIQKFMWADFFAPAGETLQYRVVPMCGVDFEHMRPLTAHASRWSARIDLKTLHDAPVRPYFNRGIALTQWAARHLTDKNHKSLKALIDPILSSTNRIRDYLGGELKSGLLDILSTAVHTKAHIYASFFQLNDPEVLSVLLKFGQRAHIILSNGARAPATPARRNKKPQKEGQIVDESSRARAELRNGNVELHDRMVAGNRLSHHSFIVFTNPDNTVQAQSVWTGSGNPTYVGMYTQINSGIVIDDSTIADRFFQQWKALVRDVTGYPASLQAFGAKSASTAIAGRKVTAWFAPNPPVRTSARNGAAGRRSDHPDLKFARDLIQNAREGILFLIFNPGMHGTLLDDILHLLQSKKRNAELLIHGAGIQGATRGIDRSSLIFVHRNKTSFWNVDEIVVPASVDLHPGMAVKEKAAATMINDWVARVNDYWQQEPAGLEAIGVHAKVILVDPFGRHPVVITGSHNLGSKESAMNDANLLVIENDPAVAAQYAVNMISIYNQYRWRFQQAEAASRRQTLNDWNGLMSPWSGQASYFTGNKKKELAFWT